MARRSLSFRSRNRPESLSSMEGEVLLSSEAEPSSGTLCQQPGRTHKRDLSISDTAGVLRGLKGKFKYTSGLIRLLNANSETEDGVNPPEAESTRLVSSR